MRCVFTAEIETDSIGSGVQAVLAEHVHCAYGVFQCFNFRLPVQFFRRLIGVKFRYVKYLLVDI
jgi:hypothetical protein